MESNRYKNEFYLKYQEGSLRSAREVIPILIKLIQPKSVVDVGCGIGTWLSVCKEFGIEDILGIDGEYAKEMLKIPQNQFRAVDLNQPFSFDREFDLVLSLETAEHLHPRNTEQFIDSLSKLGPVIVFSAAVPFQMGPGHINEQWPDYWVKLFSKKQYITIDCIRNKIWHNDNVEFWYAQNLLLFVRRCAFEKYPLLKKELTSAGITQLSVVHPKMYLRLCNIKAQDLVDYILKNGYDDVESFMNLVKQKSKEKNFR